MLIRLINRGSSEYGDLAFVQHMATRFNVKRKLGIVLPHGILFRRGAEGKIRAGLLKKNFPPFLPPESLKNPLYDFAYIFLLLYRF